MRRSAAHDVHASNALTRRPHSAQGRQPKSTQVRNPRSAQVRKIKSAQVRPDVSDGIMRPARRLEARPRKPKSVKMKVNATIDMKQLAEELPEFAKQLERLTNTVYDPEAQGVDGDTEAEGVKGEQDLEHAAVTPMQQSRCMMPITSNSVKVNGIAPQKGGRLSRTQRFENESRTAARARARSEKQERIACELGLLNILSDFDAAAASRAAKKSIAERQVFEEEWEKTLEDREKEFILRNSPKVDVEPEPIHGELEPPNCDANSMLQTIVEREV